MPVTTIDDPKTRAFTLPCFVGKSTAEGLAEVGREPSLEASVGIALGGLVGRYVVLEEIGRGGMGRVLRAYDPKLQREVALKLVRADALGEEVQARLRREARAMAKLSHPNVVGVYDVEDAPAGVVLVMELVAGVTLRQWTSERPRTWTEIVSRFVQAGQGLVAAHAQGLLHRDFKPSNVLVAESGVVKVTDFGLAKLAARAIDSTELDGAEPARSKTPSSGDSLDGVLTQANAVIGTPRYMAPEQHTSEVLTAAVDQYAFCIALWEALVGAPPFPERALDVLVERKLQGPPLWPADVTTVPRPVVEALRRGLGPSPAERWPSMEALLAALAYDPAARRRRSGQALAVGGLLGTVGLGWHAWAPAPDERCTGALARLDEAWGAPRRAAAEAAMLDIEAPFAAEAWSRTAAALDGYASEWAAMHTEACEATTVRGEQSTAVMDLRMACLHRAKVELEATTAWLADADAEVVSRAHELTASLRPLARCADVEALQAEVEPPLPAEAEAVEAVRVLLAEASTANHAGRFAAARATVDAAKERAATLEYGPIHGEVALEEGYVLDELGEYEAAEAALRRALDLTLAERQWDAAGKVARKLMFVVGYRQRHADEALRYREIVHGLAEGDVEDEATFRVTLGTVLRMKGELREAETELRLAQALYEQELGPEHLLVADALSNLGGVLAELGQHDEEEAVYRRALALRERQLGAEHPLVATTRNNLANALRRQGRYPEAYAEMQAALALRERSLGPEHPLVATTRNNLAIILQHQGQYAEAEAELRRVVTLRERALGPEHSDVASARSNLASAMAMQGKNAEAELEMRRALAAQEAVLGPDHLDVLRIRSSLGAMLQAQGKLEEAEAVLLGALAQYERMGELDHPNVDSLRIGLGNLYGEQGQHAKAEAEFRQVLAAQERRLGPEHPEVAATHGRLSGVLHAEGRLEEAEAEVRRALAVQEKVLDPDHLYLAVSRSSLAKYLLDRGQPAEALPFAELAWARLQRDSVLPTHRPELAFVLAQALWATSEAPADRTRARELAELGVVEFTAASEGARAAEVRAWLDAR